MRMRQICRVRRNRKLFVFGAAIGVIMLSIALASVPRGSRTTDGTALDQPVSEIRVPPEKAPDFDADIARLSRAESRYRERLAPARDPRLAGPLSRLSRRKYRYRAQR